jgi:hypothetical protein
LASASPLSDKTTAKHGNVVLAVPATQLSRLVMTGEPEKRIGDQVPILSELRRLRTARIFVVNVYFKEKLPDIPREPVGLAGSPGYLTFIDISQFWTSLSDIKEQHTVLVLAASNPFAFSSDIGDESAHMMIRELARYLPVVKPGDKWGASTSNIDYSKTWYQEKYSRTLFLNDIASDDLQPEACYRDLHGVFFAGDFCVNDVKMATTEAAVIGGLNAARAVQERSEGKSDIMIAPLTALSHAELLAMKLALLPVVYGAKVWSIANNALRDLENRQVGAGASSHLIGLLLSLLMSPIHWKRLTQFELTRHTKGTSGTCQSRQFNMY